VNKYELGQGPSQAYDWENKLANGKPRPYTDPGGTEATWTLKSDWRKLILDRVTAIANRMQTFFAEKNTDKLSLILEIKDNLNGKPTILNVHAGLGVIEGNVKFSFEDGSFFTVRNKVVEKSTTDWYGNWTPFYQFPTTFHQVSLPNGKLTAMYSEEQMVTDFAMYGGKKVSPGVLRWYEMLHELRTAAQTMKVQK
jgi:hypothetical protein